MEILELIKVILLGIVEGITEWIPISSTGHMILVDEFIKLNITPEFKEMFLVVIQFGAILSVVFLFWNKIFPFRFKDGFKVEKDTMNLWFKIAVSCIPAGVIGILFNDIIDDVFYNYIVVAITLIVYGILFIVIENKNKGIKPRIRNLKDLDYKTALIIGVFQLLALIPGTSRSGATIIGGILMGVSRTVSAEFTFFLAIPVMFGASFYKLLKFGFSFTSVELAYLMIGMAAAFAVSVISIKFLMGYIKKHNFKVFGWYRIVLGIIVIGYFLIKNII
jgi:undecaprenyl-diphosphatase